MGVVVFFWLWLGGSIGALGLAMGFFGLIWFLGCLMFLGSIVMIWFGLV